MNLRHALTLVLFASMLPFSAHAVQRAYVSAVSGNDTNTATGCAATAPCRWFAGAITVVDPGGEIVAMDTGAYGALTITKSISIVAAPGVYAGISVFGGNGITIATAGINVALRGLTINSMGASTHGIHMTNGAKLTIEHCVISNFSSSSYAGLFVTNGAKVGVAHSTFRDNFDGMVFSKGAIASIADSVLAGNTNYGVWVTDTYGSASEITTVDVARSVIYGSSVGVNVFNTTAGRTSRAFVSDSSIFGNYSGVQAYASAGTGHATASHNRIHGNGFGLSASDVSGHLIATGNTVTKNFYGLSQSGTAVFESAADNVVRDNATANSDGTITPFAKM
ncbi:hypothetical protein BURK2_00781 [Burkholderiales bacterium]|nr:MAG: hypothetical protein F9K47_02635 [Burkholderiales bacterium]CAG0961816.1 hypothetical protein BURK2_00781 [Burkholderiales bacterium]